MQFGLCVSAIEQARNARSWGYDYVEIFAGLLRPLESDSVWPERRRQLEETGACMSNLAAFIPGEARFVGPSVDWARTKAYIETCVGRAAEVGVKVFNWGSPFSKSVPEGWPYSRAFEQIERAANIIADEVRKHGAICVIEPINPGECNVMYYVTDGAMVSASIGRPEIRTLADFFHMSLQSEPLSHLVKAKDYLAHTHTSGPERYFPGPGQAWDQKAFLRGLRRAEYDSRLSIESWTLRPGTTLGSEATAGVAYLRKLWAEVIVEPNVETNDAPTYQAWPDTAR